MLRHIFYLLLLITLLFPMRTFAAFNAVSIGARPLGLGGAFVALADDSNAASYNAAGLGYIDTLQVGVTRVQRFNGLITYNAAAGIIPLGSLGSLGASIGILSEDSEIYREQTLRFSYGKAFLKQLSIGTNLTRFGTSFDENNEFVAQNDYFTQTSTSAISMDIGIIAKPVKGLSIGVSAENLLPANLNVSELNTDSVPRNIRAGFAYRLESIAEMSAQGETVSNLLKSSLATFEIGLRDGKTYIRAGTEIWLSKIFAIRSGYGVASDRQGGVESATTVALGGSARIPIGNNMLQIDYGFQLLTGTFQDNTTQRFSLNLLF